MYMNRLGEAYYMYAGAVYGPGSALMKQDADYGPWNPGNPDL